MSRQTVTGILHRSPIIQKLLLGADDSGVVGTRESGVSHSISHVNAQTIAKQRVAGLLPTVPHVPI